MALRPVGVAKTLSLVDPRAQLYEQNLVLHETSESREQSKIPKIPNHYPDVNPMMMSWKKRSPGGERR